MPYANLPSALAIAKTKSQTIAVTAPVAPQLKSPRKEDIDQFNSEMRVFVEQLAIALSQALTESPRKES